MTQTSAYKILLPLQHFPVRFNTAYYRNLATKKNFQICLRNLHKSDF